MVQPVPTDRQIINMVIQGLTTCMAGRAMETQKLDQEGKGGVDIEVTLLREKILCLTRALAIILEE